MTPRQQPQITLTAPRKPKDLTAATLAAANTAPILSQTTALALRATRGLWRTSGRRGEGARMTRLPAAQRREQLLDEASKLFAQLGYARATTSQLAKAAGVTEPIIYRHFASKRDLFIALI